MAQYAAAHKKFEAIIIHTDEVILQKASKISLEKVRDEMKKNYCLTETFEDMDAETTERIIKAESQIERISGNLEELEERIQKNIYAAVRRMTIQMGSTARRGPKLPV